MSNLKELTKKYLKKYKVNDVVHEETEVLFILESPHTQEIKHGYPVAGSSGQEMTRFIYESSSNDALGKLVSSPEEYNNNYNQLVKFGLLNVCPAPMQKRGLQNYDLNKEEEQVVNILEKLRVNYQATRHQNQDWNLIKGWIIDNFKQRLEKVLVEYNQIKYLVPCGKFAASYLELIKDDLEEEELKIITEIPHPSFNQWHKYDTMEKLEEVLAKTL